MRKTRVLVLALLVAGCGRMGFDAEPASDLDAPRPARLMCGEAPSFSIGDAKLRDMAAVPTNAGFAVFTSNEAKDLRGWTFTLDGADLAQKAKNLAIDADVTGAFGASSDGDDILLGSIHGAMLTLATHYHALDGSLAKRSETVTEQGRVIGAVPLATSGLTTVLPQQAFASIRYEADDVAVHGIAGAGTDLGTRMLGVAAEKPSELGITGARSSYAAVWLDTSASPNVARVALLDETYAIVKGPVTVSNDNGEDVIRPRLHWARAFNAYAVAWFEKTAGGADDVYVQILDEYLVPKFSAKLVQASAVRPKLAADETGFYIAYVNTAAKPDRIDIARVTPDGAITIRSAATSGGATTAFAMVERGGQPVLISAEDTGALTFDPLCP
jgi:hypothetical protein